MATTDPGPATVRDGPSIWVVGSTMVDMIAYTSRIPAAGETLVGDRFDLGFGGKGANQAVMAARLGAQVTIVNAVGSDAFGAMTIENLRREGIDTRFVVTIEGESSGAAPIWVEPDGTNRILIIPGANARMDARAAEDAVTDAPTVDVVVGQLEIPQAVTTAAFRAAHARGATTILNPAPAATMSAELIEATDWLVPNEVEFAALAHAMGVRAAEPTDPVALQHVQGALGTGLVVTLGSAGAVAVGRDGRLVRVTAPAVDAVDSTGAGDAFVGAFADAIGRRVDIETALRVACALASDSVRRTGTQKSFPSALDARAIARRAGRTGPAADHLPH